MQGHSARAEVPRAPPLSVAHHHCTACAGAGKAVRAKSDSHENEVDFKEGRKHEGNLNPPVCAVPVLWQENPA